MLFSEHGADCPSLTSSGVEEAPRQAAQPESQHAGSTLSFRLCRSCFNLMALSFLMHEIGTQVTCAPRGCCDIPSRSVQMVCDVPAGAYSNSIFTGSHLVPGGFTACCCPLLLGGSQ